jgi:hypothetical protein
MRYTIETFRESHRIATDTNLDIIKEKSFLPDLYFIITNNLTKEVYRINDYDNYLEWREGPEKATAWKPKKNSPISPSHYKNFNSDEQWLTTMSGVFKDLTEPLLFQVHKYIARVGQKDATKQELKKAHFYLTYLIKYLENDKKKLRVEDIEHLILK